MSSSLGYGRLRGLLFSFGGFGEHFTFDIAEIYAKHGFDPNEFVALLIHSDRYIGQHWTTNKEEKGFSDEVSPEKEINVERAKIGKRLVYCPISERVKLPGLNIQAGVGTFWPLSARVVREGFDKLYEGYKDDVAKKGYSLDHFSVFIFAAGSGGGVGNGSAPVFAPLFIRKLEDEFHLKSPDIFPMGVTVLPFKYDPKDPYAEPNSLTFIGRFSRCVKTLFIGDNKYVSDRKGLGREEAARKVNEILAWSLLGIFFMNYVPGPSRYESADYVRHFSKSGRSSFVVPTFVVFKLEEFETWLNTQGVEGIAKIIVDQLISNLAAEIDLERESSFILVNALLPRGTKLPRNFEEVLRERIHQKFKACDKCVHIGLGEIPGIYNVYFTLYLVDPLVPRLRQIYEQNAGFFENERSLESLAKGMLETIPDEFMRKLDVSNYIQLIKEAFSDAREILEDYLSNWGLSLSTPYSYRRSFFPKFIPRINFVSESVREFLPLEVEVIKVFIKAIKETTERQFLEELTLTLNEETPLATTYTFIDYADKTFKDFISDVSNLLSSRVNQGKLFPYIKIWEAYLPLEDHSLKYPVKELSALKNSKVALVYILESEEESKEKPLKK